jgi:DNA (cytosine-5)-methyltransferase 1
MLTFGDLFSGIGGGILGLQRAGMVCRWAVEIDPACRQVLARQFPGLPLHVDVRDVGAHNLAPVDVIFFGSPCQGLSLAGKQKGFADARSGLFFEAVRVLDELRPALGVWENVPGALSSNAGRDFHTALLALAELGARDIGWSVLNAQFFGVAQRRRRVFTVADFRAERAGEILFDPEGVRWHPAACGEAGTVTPALIASGAGVSRTGNERTEAEFLVCGALTTGVARPDDNKAQAGHVVAFDTRNLNETGEVTLTLQAKPSGGWSLNYQPVICESDTVAGTVCAKWAKGTGGPSGDECQNIVVTHALTARHDSSEDGSGRGLPLVFQPRFARNGRGEPDAIVPCLTAQAGETGKGDAAPVLLAFSGKDDGRDVDALSPTLRAMNHADSRANGGGQVAIAEGSPAGFIVRRLTPLECERLQGFPDGWTDGQSDAKRYHQLGNAVCVNVMEWLGRRLVRVCGE